MSPTLALSRSGVWVEGCYLPLSRMVPAPRKHNYKKSVAIMDEFLYISGMKNCKSTRLQLSSLLLGRSN